MSEHKKERLLIGSPIHQKPTILHEFLHSLCEIQTEADFYFVDDNIDLRSKLLLQNFKKNRELAGSLVFIDSSNQVDEYIKNEYTHHWNEQLIWKVAGFKDSIIEYARENDYDYLFLVDSDLLLHPQTINKLVETGKDIVSEVFWTKWQSDSIEEPQVWLEDEYSQVPNTITDNNNMDADSSALQFYMKLKIPGVYKVGGLGACTLISRRALDAGVRFEKIYNLSFWGEDRHFCVRAAALGLELFVETTYPAYHIYRPTDLDGIAEFKENNNYSTINPIPESKGARLTLSMIVKDEANNKLRETLSHAKRYIDDAVIIDDNSTDNTREIVREVLEGIPFILIENDRSKFHNEVELRKQQWEEVIKTNPEWIINLDADEQFEDAFITGVRDIINELNVYLFSFRLYDFWTDTAYRYDTYWQAHLYYRPFLLKYVSNYDYLWQERSQHCGRFPYNVFQLPNKTSQYRVKHFGWASERIREEKAKRYELLDPNAEHGVLGQYRSILDEHPNLIEWKD